MKETSETIEVAHDDHEEGGLPGFLTPDVTLLLTTWILFFVLLYVLSKYAWKPILTSLDAREARIKKSVEDADKIKEELDNLAERQQEMISEAESKSKAIIDDARKAAAQASKHITDKAKQEAQIILENARRDIKEELKEAQATLREESANIAIELAGKIIEDDLDENKSKNLITKYISEL